jgi:GAF domain-containing protein
MATKAQLEQQVAELRATQARTETLYQISRDLNLAGNESELLQVLAQPAQDAGAYRAVLFFIDLDETGSPEWLELVAHWEQAEEPPVPVGTRYYLPEFHLADLWLKYTNEPLLITDAASDQRLDKTIKDIYAGLNTRASAIIPLTQSGYWVGLITVNWSTPHEFDEREVTIYSALADLAGSTVAVHRLAREAHSKAEELNVLNELSRALTTCITVDHVLERTYQGISQLLDTTNYYVGLYDPGRNEVTFTHNITESQVDREITTMPADQGLTGHIIQNQTPILVQDNFDEWLAQAGIEQVGEPARSWLGVPMMVGERVLGVISLQNYDTPHMFDEHDQNLLAAFANQAAIALQNAQMVEETQRRVREVQLLHSVGLTAASGARLEETLQAAVQAIATEFGATMVGIALVDWEESRLRVAASVGYPSEVLTGTISTLDEGITGWVARHNEPVLIPDVREDPRYIDVASDTRSELCVPLVVGSQVIGVLNVESPQPNAFTSDDLRLLSTLAHNLGVVTELARLVESLEQMVEERTTDLRESLEEREQLQQEVIEAQKQALKELSTPIIPVLDHIIVMPLIGAIDTLRARDITRALLAGIREHQAKVVILDITGVPIIDSGVASYLNKTIQAARLKGARTIVTGTSEAVAETIVDLGIDWSGIETLPDMRAGLVAALRNVGIKLTRYKT